MINSSNHPMILQAKEAAFKPNFWLQLVMFYVVFSATSSITSIFIVVPVLYKLFFELDIINAVSQGIELSTEMLTQQIMGDPLIMLISLLVTGITTLAVIFYCRKIEKRSYFSMGFTKDGWIKHYLIGFAIGTGMLFVCAVIAYLAGSMQFAFSEKIAVGYILIFFIGFVIQGMSEEVVLRSYFMISLSTSCKVPIAIGVSSVVFSLLHITNPGFGLIPFLNITLFGIFMALYVLKTKNIWGACAIHSAWNFMQGNVLGIQVSGTGHLPTVAIMEPLAGHNLLSGGSFGLEGGLIVTGVLIIAIVITLFADKIKSAALKMV